MGKRQRVKPKRRRNADIYSNGLAGCCHQTIRLRKERIARNNERPTLEQLPCSSNACKNIMWYSKTGRMWEWFAFKRIANVTT